MNLRPNTKIFIAEKIITMHPEQPLATAVAVRDGRILAVGNAADVIFCVKNSPFRPYVVDNTFEDKIFMPGLVDAHTHVQSQAHRYSGHFVAQIPWPRPEGGFFPVYPTKADVLNRLQELDKTLPLGEVLFAVAYDENKAGGFLHIGELDAVSRQRPVLVTNMVNHRFWVNSATLEEAGIDMTHPPDGVEVGPDGKANGTLLEYKGMMSVLPAFPDLMNITREKMRYILPLFAAGGHTTVCDAIFGRFGLQQSIVDFKNLFSEPDANLRVVGLPFAKTGIPEAGSLDEFIRTVKTERASGIDNFRIGAVKLYLDGSIISRTSPIGWPGYWDGTAEPHMQEAPEVIHDLIIRLHDAGIPTVTHANSRPGCQVILEAVREAQSLHYRPDMRHRIEHAYTISEAQLKQARELGVAIQFFTTQIYYYGDGHLKLQGPDRAHHITPTATAKRLGVSWGFHNDPPGTPQLPWMAAWTTVHRSTQESKTILGPHQRMSVADVLHAMTLEHAYQLHLDHEIGSIQFGKKADFCVLEADPLEIDPMELKDMPVWGTVFGGELNPAETGIHDRN
jgi:hypothetical protein